MADSIVKPDARPLTLTLLAAADEEFTQIREQLSRATQLEHPNLLRIAGAGCCRLGPGEELLYLASEAADETLAEVCRSAPITEHALLAVLQDVLNALAFVHERGLVHRGVEPQAIVRVGASWKLADYGRLHRAGTPDAQIGSFLNGSRYTPPEAYSGLVLPAWDLWDLASVVLEALTGRAEEGVLPPPPFDAVVRGCLQTSPEARPELDEVRRLLGLSASAAIPVAMEPPAADDRCEAPPASGSAVSRWRWMVAGGLAVLAGLAMIIGTYRSRSRTTSAVQPAPATVKAPSTTSQPPSAPAQPLPKAKTPPLSNEGRPETGMADYVSAERHGRRTASGERFSSASPTAAHRTYPLGARIRVTNLKNGRSMVVRINDRGIHRRGYIIRVTRRVAEELRFASAGSAQVRLEPLD